MKEIKKIIYADFIDNHTTCDTGLTVSDWIDIINNKEITSENVKYLLVKWYKSPDHDATCSEIANQINKNNITGDTIKGTMNSYLKKVCDYLSVNIIFKDDNEERKYPILFNGYCLDKSNNQNRAGAFAWQLKDEVVKAIDELGLVNQDLAYTISNITQGKTTMNKVYRIYVDKKNTCLDVNNPHICLCWPEVGDLSNFNNLEDIKELCRKTYPNLSQGLLSTIYYSLNRFKNKTNVGDLVLYREIKDNHKDNNDIVHIGQITSDYIYNEEDIGDDKEYKHIRKVKWLKTVCFDEFSDELKDSLNDTWHKRGKFIGLNKYYDEIVEKLNSLEDTPIYQWLMNHDDIDPDSFDGKYQLLREIINAYKNVDENKLDSNDINLIYFSTVSTWYSKFKRTENLINYSHLPEENKEELLILLNEIEEKTNSGKYLLDYDNEYPSSFLRSSKSTIDVSSEDVRKLIKMFIHINESTTLDACKSIIEETLKDNIPYIQSGVLSPILHTLKPTIFPIFDGIIKDYNNVFKKLGINIKNIDLTKSYLDNTILIQEFKEKHFKFKNNILFNICAKETMNIETEDIKENAYSINDFLNDVFISKEEYQDIIELLKRKKNIILSGTPGVGKSYMAKKLAYAFMGEVNDENIEMVQFHQSYSYEDFIYGYQANGTGFELTPGIFYSFSKKASENKDKPYFFIIDEINRGNLSKIFGELFMLIENDKRETASLILSHTKEKFTIPDNLYIIGMMNTADRSLAMVDYALRRRFSFVKVRPAFNSDSFKKYLKKNNTSSSMIDKIVERFTELNKEIAIDASLGEDFEIGHSYFCDNKEAITEARYQAIIKYDIKPILDEYYFDNKEKAEELYKKLIG